MSLYAAVLVIRYHFIHVLEQHVPLSFTLLFNFASLPFRLQLEVVTYANNAIRKFELEISVGESKRERAKLPLEPN